MALTRPRASQLNTNTIDFSDPLVRINKGQSGANDKDIGIVLERGTDTNVAFIWDESADQFAVINTDETRRPIARNLARNGSKKDRWRSGRSDRGNRDRNGSESQLALDGSGSF